MNTDGIKLWLDDKRPAPPGWHWVHTVSEAQEQLRTGRVVAASLDFKLRRPRNGEDLVSWMARTGYWPQTRPRVHSSNLLHRVWMPLRIAWHWVRRSRRALTPAAAVE